MADFAKGIQRNHYPGDEKQLKPGMLVDYFVQHHLAKKRGPHYDFRIGDKNTKLFSWASTPHPLNQHEGSQLGMARTNLHRHSYGSWEGMIPPGYGHGLVKKDSAGKALITRTGENSISFTIGDNKEPKRFALIRPGDKYGKNFWLMRRQPLPDDPKLEKTKYKSVDADKAERFIAALKDTDRGQPKVDGALQFLLFGKNKVELVSHRLSVDNNKPVLHTERVFGERPKINVPKELRNTAALVEIYGAKGDKPIPPQETSALLNSTITKSLTDQKDRGITLKGMIFGLVNKGEKGLDTKTDFESKQNTLNRILKILPKDKFHLPESTTGAKAINSLWEQIKNKQHPLTTEGIVVHHENGKPTKIKDTSEDDVFIRKFFDGEGKYKGKGIGGFEYSHTKDGPIVGKVGSGLSDKLREVIYDDPKQFIGRKARVKSQGKLPSGALRAPVLINLHEG